jgi:hypothetical protein
MGKRAHCAALDPVVEGVEEGPGGGAFKSLMLCEGAVRARVFHKIRRRRFSLTARPATGSQTAGGHGALLCRELDVLSNS